VVGNQSLQTIEANTETSRERKRNVDRKMQTQLIVSYLIEYVSVNIGNVLPRDDLV